MIHHRNMPGHPEYQRQRLEQATHQLGLNQGEHQKNANAPTPSRVDALE